MKAANVLPTLPSFAAVSDSAAERTALLAGLTFIEGATTWRLPELLGWYRTYGAVLNVKAPPDSVSDAVVGTIVLPQEGPPRSSRMGAEVDSGPLSTPGSYVQTDRSTPPRSRKQLAEDIPPRSRRTRAGLEELPKLLAMSRWRVIITVRGLLSTPCDDRFLQSAIFAGRVRRRRSEWIAEPHEADMLSDVVLSLFAVDVLTYREFHEQNLCVCDVCGRISYNPAVTTRSGCSDHHPRDQATSGFQGKTCGG